MLKKGLIFVLFLTIICSSLVLARRAPRRRYIKRRTPASIGREAVRIVPVGTEITTPPLRGYADSAALAFRGNRENTEGRLDRETGRVWLSAEGDKTQEVNQISALFKSKPFYLDKRAKIKAEFFYDLPRGKKSYSGSGRLMMNFGIRNAATRRLVLVQITRGIGASAPSPIEVDIRRVFGNNKQTTIFTSRELPPGTYNAELVFSVKTRGLGSALLDGGSIEGRTPGVKINRIEMLPVRISRDDIRPR